MEHYRFKQEQDSIPASQAIQQENGRAYGAGRSSGLRASKQPKLSSSCGPARAATVDFIEYIWRLRKCIRPVGTGELEETTKIKQVWSRKKEHISSVITASGTESNCADFQRKRRRNKGSCPKRGRGLE